MALQIPEGGSGNFISFHRRQSGSNCKGDLTKVPLRQSYSSIGNINALDLFRENSSLSWYKPFPSVDILKTTVPTIN